MGEEFQLLKTFQNPIDAHIAKGSLKANGIDSFIFDENTVYANPILTTAIGGVKLLVYSVDFENAYSMLNEIDEDDNEESLTLVCPVCSSKNVKIKNPPNWTYFLIMLFSFTSTPTAGNRKKYGCIKCGHKWQDSK
jgi:DNA-directed RNA polymerase subunit RPC12/RpoP